MKKFNYSPVKDKTLDDKTINNLKKYMNKILNLS